MGNAHGEQVQLAVVGKEGPEKALLAVGRASRHLDVLGMNL